MKLGILTFHSQLNYGGVLQCWALKTVLEGMGHEVEIVDRWLDSKNKMLNGPFGNAGLQDWIKIFLRSLLGCGDWRQVVRHWRTRRFVRDIGLTPYHFYDWKDAPKDLGVDCLVVGSDQVWHGGDWGYPDPKPYLLEGAPHVKSIAYAASFGLKSLHSEYDYAAGFNRFSAISVREAEGVDLVKGAGYAREVKHVVDPTLLLDPAEWKKFEARKKVAKRLVCYFLSEDVDAVIPVLEVWARKNDWTVQVLCNGYVKPLPKSIMELARRLKGLASKVRVCSDYGPQEFVRAFARADAVITDSFHAIMVSSIYGCNARFLRPQKESRKAMFARVSEFGGKCVTGDFFADDVMQALASFERGETISFNSDSIAAMRSESVDWLQKAIAG